ncbi:MAG: BrnT family toxin [Polaromonas sp.]|nr:BrnT family toxin [Polaromonas sp.]
MQITFDDAKNQKNIEDRKLNFELVYSFEFESAIYAVDVRRYYGEIRHRALGFQWRCMFTHWYLSLRRNYKEVRVISF